MCEGLNQNFESVRIIDCYAALLILAYGFMLSFMLLLMEGIVAHYNRKQIKSIMRIRLPLASNSSDGLIIQQ